MVNYKDDTNDKAISFIPKLLEMYSKKEKISCPYASIVFFESARSNSK